MIIECNNRKKMMKLVLLAAVGVTCLWDVKAFGMPRGTKPQSSTPMVGRREATWSFFVSFSSPFCLTANAADDLKFVTAPSGLQWADAKVGTGVTPSKGGTVAVDYVMSTTGARYGSKIYSTIDRNAPYRFTLGDSTTIAGLEQAILGDEGTIPPMKPGGIRRLIIPSNMAYQSLADTTRDCDPRILGPIPPPTEAFEEYQRFKNIYCNPNRAYQPDLVLDIKLYGKRT